MLYKLYFELFGKKMQCEIEANSRYDAKEQVREKIEFHKITPDKDEPRAKCDNFDDNPSVDYLKDIFFGSEK